MRLVASVGQQIGPIIGDSDAAAPQVLWQSSVKLIGTKELFALLF